jgi:hypothetical protein
MLRRVALVRTDVSEGISASIIRVRRIGELGTLAATSNRRTLRRNTDEGAKYRSYMLGFETWPSIPEHKAAIWSGYSASGPSVTYQLTYHLNSCAVDYLLILGYVPRAEEHSRFPRSGSTRAPEQWARGYNMLFLTAFLIYSTFTQLDGIRYRRSLCSGYCVRLLRFLSASLLPS